MRSAAGGDGGGLLTQPARAGQRQSSTPLHAVKHEHEPVSELSVAASALGGGVRIPLAGLALGSDPLGPSGGTAAAHSDAAPSSRPSGIIESLRRMAAATGHDAPMPVQPAGAVIRRAIDLSDLDGPQIQDVIAAYRADQTGSAMWGRESDLQGLSSSLGVRIHVVDYSASQGAHYSTNVQQIYSPPGRPGRDIYLRYTGDHYNILHPDSRGRFELVEEGTERRFRSEPVPGDGNCLFAAVWKSARAESDAKHEEVAPDQAPPDQPDQGQAFLRRLCHGDSHAVSDARVLDEVAILDPAGLAREHIGPALTNALGALRLIPAPEPAPAPDAAKHDAALGEAQPALGPDAVKKVEDMKLAPDVVKARLARFANSPAYWADLEWRAVDDNLMKADLLFGHPKFDEIAAAVAHGLARRPYVSPAKESTRMEVVHASLKRLNEARPLTRAQASKEATLERRLREKSNDRKEVSPPRSRPVDVERIEVIANQRLWNSYQAATRSVRDDLASRGDSEPLASVSFDGAKSQLLDPKGGLLPVGEANLFHGTSPSTMDILESSGFDPSFSANKAKPGAKTARYGPLGQGVYFADVMSKAMTYSQCPVCSDYDCEEHRDQAGQMMMARVALGHTKKARAFAQHGDLRADDMRTLKDDRHSVYSKGWAASDKNPFSAASGLNEFVVKEAAQVYPEFRIHYRVKPPVAKK